MDLGTTFWTPSVGPSPFLATDRRSNIWRNMVTAKGYHTLPITKPHDLMASTAGGLPPNASWTANSYELTARHALNAVVAQGHVKGWTGAIGTGQVDVRHWNVQRLGTVAWAPIWGQFLGSIDLVGSRCNFANEYNIIFDISVSISSTVTVQGTGVHGAAPVAVMPPQFTVEWVLGAPGEAVGLRVLGWDMNGPNPVPIGGDFSFVVIGSPFGASFDPTVYEGNVNWPDSNSPD
jgi:hypothetical protein